MLGRKAYADLPRYAKAFDVALMPFRVNELTLAANPLKVREYLAAGLPVVSTAIPDVVRNFAPFVDVAASHGEFLALAARSCERVDAARIARGIDLAAANTWEAIVVTMRAHVLDAVRARETTAPAAATGD